MAPDSLQMVSRWSPVGSRAAPAAEAGARIKHHMRASVAYNVSPAVTTNGEAQQRVIHRYSGSRLLPTRSSGDVGPHQMVGLAG